MPRAFSHVALLDQKTMRSWYALMAARSKPALQKPDHHLPDVQLKSAAGPRAGTSHLRTELSLSLLPVVSSWKLEQPQIEALNPAFQTDKLKSHLSVISSENHVEYCWVLKTTKNILLRCLNTFFSI